MAAPPVKEPDEFLGSPCSPNLFLFIVELAPEFYLFLSLNVLAKRSTMLCIELQKNDEPELPKK